VVVHDLDVFGPAGGPAEADAVQVVDADAVLAGAVAPELLEPAAWGTRRSSSRPAISNWRSLRRATASMFTNRFTRRPRASCSVSPSLIETIMHR
jgi:hypothetical protein